MLETWLVAVVGGAAGSLLTLLARYAAVPAEVDQHDRQVADIDSDLDRYAADEYARHRNVALAALAPKPRIERMTVQPDRSKVLAHQFSLAVSASMQLYRDERTARTGEHREVATSESWLHRTYRRLHRHCGPLAELKTPERAQAFLNRWPALPISRAMHMPDPRGRSIEAACRLLDEEAKAE
jgi:hypothetical protein